MSRTFLPAQSKSKYLWKIAKKYPSKRSAFSIFAAIREVEEECGIKIESSGEKICNTYHIYEMNGARVIKKTAWYWMKSSKQEKLIPQLEEGITDVRWISKSDLSLVRENTYPLIKDLLQVIDLIL
jgi:8-oxo-dGTP pyrophosphatase MutT (NUDIX family)